MGEMADDIIGGYCCALCGQYFDEPIGYPCVCPECWTFDCGYEKTHSE